MDLSKTWDMLVGQTFQKPGRPPPRGSRIEVCDLGGCMAHYVRDIRKGVVLRRIKSPLKHCLGPSILVKFEDGEVKWLPANAFHKYDDDVWRWLQ